MAFGIRTLHSRKGVIFSLRSRPVSGFLLMEMDDGKIRVEFNSGGGCCHFLNNVVLNENWYIPFTISAINMIDIALMLIRVFLLG